MALSGAAIVTTLAATNGGGEDPVIREYPSAASDDPGIRVPVAPFDPEDPVETDAPPDPVPSGRMPTGSDFESSGVEAEPSLSPNPEPVASDPVSRPSPIDPPVSTPRKPSHPPPDVDPCDPSEVPDPESPSSSPPLDDGRDVEETVPDSPVPTSEGEPLDDAESGPLVGDHSP